MTKLATTPAHTPGPWFVGHSQNPDVYRNQRHLAIISHPEMSTGKVVADIETLPQERANAYLIAQAPRFLALAEELIGQWEHYVTDPDAICLEHWADHVARWISAVTAARRESA